MAHIFETFPQKAALKFFLISGCFPVDAGKLVPNALSGFLDRTIY